MFSLKFTKFIDNIKILNYIILKPAEFLSSWTIWISVIKNSYWCLKKFEKLLDGEQDFLAKKECLSLLMSLRYLALQIKKHLSSTLSIYNLLAQILENVGQKSKK